MILQLPLSEIEDYIKTCYNINVSIKYIETNKLEINYLFAIGITIKEVLDYSIILGYELSWATNILAKGAKFMTNNSIYKNILDWDTSKKEVKLNLVHIPALNGFLKIYRISSFLIDNNVLFLKLSK